MAQPTYFSMHGCVHVRAKPHAFKVADASLNARSSSMGPHPSNIPAHQSLRDVRNVQVQILDEIPFGTGQTIRVAEHMVGTVQLGRMIACRRLLPQIESVGAKVAERRRRRTPKYKRGSWLGAECDIQRNCSTLHTFQRNTSVAERTHNPSCNRRGVGSYTSKVAFTSLAAAVKAEASRNARCVRVKSS